MTKLEKNELFLFEEYRYDCPCFSMDKGMFCTANSSNECIVTKCPFIYWSRSKRGRESNSNLCECGEPKAFGMSYCETCCNEEV